MLFSSEMDDIRLEALPVMIWKALLQHFSLINFTVHTRYIFKSIPENLREISCDLDLIKINFNCQGQFQFRLSLTGLYLPPEVHLTSPSHSPLCPPAWLPPRLVTSTFPR